MFNVEPPSQLILGLVTGIGFGFLLQKAGVAKYQTILGQLLLKDWTAFKVMLTASVTGAIGVYLLVDMGAANLDVWPFQPAAMIIGAIFFGVGIAILGYCPGTGLAGAAEGSRDAMWGVFGMISGAGVLVIGFDWLEPRALALGDFGRLTIPTALGASPWPILAAFGVVAMAALLLVELRDRRASGA